MTHIVAQRWGCDENLASEIIFLADEIKKRGTTSYAQMRKLSKAYNRKDSPHSEEMRELHYYGELKVLYDLRLIKWLGGKGRTKITWIGD